MGVPFPNIEDEPVRRNFEYLDKLGTPSSMAGGAVAKFAVEGFVIPPEGVTLSRSGNTVTGSGNGRIRKTVSVTSLANNSVINYGYSETFSSAYPLNFSFLPAILWAKLGGSGYVFAIVRITEDGDDETPCSFEVLEDLSIGMDQIMFLGPFFPQLGYPINALFISRTSLSDIFDLSPEVEEFFGSADIAFGGYLGSGDSPVETPIGVKCATVDIPDDTVYELDLGADYGRVFVTSGIDSQLVFTGSPGTSEGYGWELVIQNDGNETLVITEGFDEPYYLNAGESLKVFITNGVILPVTI